MPLLISPFYRGGNGGSERPSNQLKVAQLVGQEGEQECWDLNPGTLAPVLPSKLHTFGIRTPEEYIYSRRHVVTDSISALLIGEGFPGSIFL